MIPVVDVVHDYTDGRSTFSPVAAAVFSGFYLGPVVALVGVIGVFVSAFRKTSPVWWVVAIIVGAAWFLATFIFLAWAFGDLDS